MALAFIIVLQTTTNYHCMVLFQGESVIYVDPSAELNTMPSRVRKI